MTNSERLSVYRSQPYLLFGVEVFMHEDGSMGMYAIEDIEVENTLMVVPSNLVLYSFDEYAWSSIFSKTDQYYVQFAARLLYERFESTSDNFVTQYVKSLPHEINLLSDFSEEQKEEFYEMME